MFGGNTGLGQRRLPSPGRRLTSVGEQCQLQAALLEVRLSTLPTMNGK
jgi:type II secretory ATPase GspE/PulE/Tfp pilus assembly ATPase PilB-like protein